MGIERTIDHLVEASSIGEGLREMDENSEMHLHRLTHELTPA